MKTNTSSVNPPSAKKEPNIKNLDPVDKIIAILMHRRFVLALKSSVSVGCAVFFGLIYSKDNGIWSGLPVAISFAASREAVFRVSNMKLQGTMIGTVYGVLGCFALKKYVKVRFLILLPWFVFCSLIRRSRMYGPAGGVSAVIGAVLVLGRENFGPPMDFAIIRIVEAFIGLSCSILVELMFRPARASTLAKNQLSKTLQALHECICMVSLGSRKDGNTDGLKKLKANVIQLRKFIQEAELEPNFWFLPFHDVCYNKLLKTLSNMEGLLVFLNHANESLEQKNLSFKTLEPDVEIFKQTIQSSIKCFERVVLVKSLNQLDKELQNQRSAYDASNTSVDVEMGKLPIHPHKSNVKTDDGMENMVNSYLQRSREVVSGEEYEGGKGNNEVVLSLSAFAFCLGGLVKETREIEKGIMELLQWENPSSHVNLDEITSKLHAISEVRVASV